MNTSIISELKSHVQDLINDNTINHENIDDAHHIAFNQDYYIIGYYQADQWLKKHNVSAWEAMDYVFEQNHLHFGAGHEVNIFDINSEDIVSQLVFFAGYDINIEEILEDNMEAE